MYLLMSYGVGVTVEALVLARARNRMRVVISGFPDTIELKRSGTQWVDQDRQPVEFEFLMCSASEAQSLSAPQSNRTHTAAE